MNKSKVFLVIFLLSVILVGPIIMANAIKKENSQNVNLNQEQNQTDIKENEKAEITVDLNKDNKIETNNEKSNEKNNIKENKIEESKVKELNNALFIGDSRTVGIMEYGNLKNVTFFANTGLSVYNVREKTISIPNIGKLTLEELLSNKKFDRIYIMLGINELGYDMNQTIKKYGEFVDYINNKQPKSTIYIQANLHVTKQKSDNDKIYNNKNIDILNNGIKKFADNKKIFYIDINEKFDDEYGNLPSKYTSDQVHIYAKYYKDWSNWILEK